MLTCTEHVRIADVCQTLAYKVAVSSQVNCILNVIIKKSNTDGLLNYKYLQIVERSSFHRKRRCRQWQPEADPGAGLAPDSALPDRQEQDSAQEADVGMATGCHPRMQHRQLHLRLE